MSYPNDNNNPWKSLADFLIDKIEVAPIATAIEKEHIYTWDRFGRMIKATQGDGNDPYSEMTALDLLALVYKNHDEAEQARDGGQLRHELDDFIEDYEGPLNRFGWPSDECPDFAAYKPQYGVPKAVANAAKPEESDLLPTRTRTSLDTMIRALVRIAKIPTDDLKPYKLAGSISRTIEENGESLGSATIANHLKRIFDKM